MKKRERKRIKGEAMAAMDAVMDQGGTVGEGLAAANEILDRHGLPWMLVNPEHDPKGEEANSRAAYEASSVVTAYVKRLALHGDAHAYNARQTFLGLMADLANSGDPEDREAILSILEVVRYAYDAGKASADGKLAKAIRHQRHGDPERN